ncbi:MAG: carbohydrate ABC transporter permease [Spirochaetaceae bacterium]|nr:MAG: carbohydrate ABC transporter permease [Spirochaetaceae bacterium]
MASGAYKFQRSVASRIADVAIIATLTFLACVTIFPFYNVLIMSVARYRDIVQTPLYIWPQAIDLTAYRLIFMDRLLVNSFLVSIAITLGGTAISMFITIPTAWALSKPDLPGRNGLFVIVIFSMYFSGGLIPWYLVIRGIGLLNTLWVLMIPVAFNTFFMILMKNYFLTMPESLEESARIDGATNPQILLRIVIPTAAPIMATISLFYAVARWNDWFMGMLFIRDPLKLPLQNVLRRVVVESNLELGNVMAQAMRDSVMRVYPMTIQMATVVVSTIPILLVYPFLQKHFTKGIMLGSIKA